MVYMYIMTPFTVSTCGTNNRDNPSPQAEQKHEHSPMCTFLSIIINVCGRAYHCQHCSCIVYTPPVRTVYMWHMMRNETQFV